MKSAVRKFTIGRDKQCDVPIADDSVSRLHAELTLSDDGKLSLADRGSSNGTVLIRQGKQQSVRQETVLLTDRIRFGTVELGVKDLLESIGRKYPDVGIERFAGGGSRSSAAHSSQGGDRLVRCGCGTIKPANGRCPSCGE